MRKIFTQGLFVSICFLLVTCQKLSQTLPKENNTESTHSRAGSQGGCRHTSYDYFDSFAGIHLTDYFTYKNGLLDEVLTSYGYRYVLEYNDQNRLIVSKVYEGATLLYVIDFSYENNKVVKETWRDAATHDIYDEIIITYNQQGRMLKNWSYLLDYGATYTYTRNGSLATWNFFVGGALVTTADYTYENNYRNSMAAIAGPQHDFWYGNSGFGIGIGQTWYSSEKLTVYDADGTPTVYYAIDPAKTVWHIGDQHYPLQAEYFAANDQKIVTTFEFENCNPGQEAKAVLPNVQKNTDKSKYFKVRYKNIIEKIRGQRL